MSQTEARELFLDALGTKNKEQDGLVYPILLEEAKRGLKYNYLQLYLMILPKLKAKEQFRIQ